MTCHGESCKQGRAVCTEGCNKSLIQATHDWERNERYDSAADIAARLPILILSVVLGCISFAISVWMLLGDSGLTYALAKLVRTLFSLT